MEHSSFFNSVAGDRKYQASDYAAYFNSFITNGVFPDPGTNLQVIANGDMTVTVSIGKGWINGYFYSNDSILILPLDVADGVLKRIDRVVIQFNTINRSITAKVKKSTFASTPVAPTLQRDADAYELGIADIYIANGATSVSQANITDLRMNTTLCGWVNSLIQADTTAIFTQYQAWFTANQSSFNTDLTDYTTTKQGEINTWFTDTQSTTQTDLDAMEAQFNTDWSTWFATVQGMLAGDIAGNLATQIANLNGAGGNVEKANKAALDATNVAAANLAGTGRTTETVKKNADDVVALQKAVAASQAILSVEIAQEQLSQDLNIIDLAVNLETLKGATLTGVIANIFVETFLSLTDITLSHGVFDATNKKVYLT